MSNGATPADLFLPGGDRVGVFLQGPGVAEVSGGIAGVPPTFNALELTPAYLMMLVKGPSNLPLNTNSVSALAYGVFDLTVTPPTQLVVGSLVVNTVIFNTLQTPTLDPRWTRDSTGYNFGALLPAATFPSGKTRLRLEVNFTPTSGEVFTRRVDFKVDDLLSR